MRCTWKMKWNQIDATVRNAVLVVFVAVRFESKRRVEFHKVLLRADANRSMRAIPAMAARGTTEGVLQEMRAKASAAILTKQGPTGQTNIDYKAKSTCHMGGTIC